MSWRTRSREEFASTTPVSPPTVNRNTNPSDQIKVGVRYSFVPYKVATHLNTFTPVGTAIIIVAVVK